MNQKKNSPFESLILPGVILIALGVYLPALKNHLVADSWVFVYPRDLAETLSFFFKSIIPPEWNALWLRPLPMLTFWADNKIWPGTEWGPNLTNIAFHLLNVFLVMKIVNISRVYSTSSMNNIKYGLPEFIAGTLFGIHPMTVGAVGWVGARFDVMGNTLGLLSSILWFKWDSEGRKKKVPLLFLTVLILALLCKEQSVVFLFSSVFAGIIMAYNSKGKAIEYLPVIIGPIIILVIYTIYRFIIFHGAGGYMESGGGFNLAAPFAFFTAIIFPWMNIFPNWSFGYLFWISSLVITLLTILQWNNFRRTSQVIKPVYVVMPILISAIGLFTTLPHTGIRFSDIVGHAESRFSLIAVTGLSILAGVLSSILVKSSKIHKTILFIVCIAGIGFTWRTGVQIQAWGDAGETANGIITTVLSEAPNPQQDSKMFFFDIPRGNDQFAYIFGIGLKEAILRNYPGRDDKIIIPDAQGKDLKKVDVNRDYVFGFNKSKWKLERLYARKKSESAPASD
jgi:hypothetical protein